METQIIDMLYLELSQVTKATTAKELQLQKEIDRLKIQLQNITHNQDKHDQELWDAAKDLAVHSEDSFAYGKYLYVKHAYATLKEYKKSKIKEPS